MSVSASSGRRDFFRGLLGSGVELKEASGIVGCGQAQPASLLVPTRCKYAQDLREMLWFIPS